MGRYITKANVEAVFGREWVRKHSNLNHEDTNAAVNDTRVDESIEYAEDYFDDRLRNGRYTVPLSNAPSTVKNICAKLAGVWLYESNALADIDDEADDPIARHRDHAESKINAIVAGSIRLDSELSATEPSAPTIV